MSEKKAASLLRKLTKTEQDFLSHIEEGYRLETNSLGGDSVLRRLIDNEEMRPRSADRISPGKGRDPLTESLEAI